MQSVTTVVNTLIAYGALQALLISVVLLRSKSRTLFMTLFSVLLLIEGITLIERLLVETDWIRAVPHLIGISHPISFLKPPLMWFMAMAVTVKGFQLSKKAYLHGIPFVLMLLLNAPIYFLDGARKLEFVEGFMNKVPSYKSFEFYFTLSFFLYIGIYIFWSIKRLNSFRQLVTNNGLVNWYRAVLLAYSGFLVIHLVYFLIQPIGAYNFAMFNQVGMLAMTFIVQSIAIKLMGRSSLLNTQTPDLTDLEERKVQEQRIIEKLELDKIYLDEDLNLKKFSNAVELPSSKVSSIINQKYNCTFKKLVNRYRIDEAKERMRNASEDKIKLIELSFDVGFNNKVSFYRAFKEFENLSPSEYLEKAKKAENS